MPSDKQSQKAGDRSTLEQAGGNIIKAGTINMGLSYGDVRQMIQEERDRIAGEIWSKAQQMLREAGVTPGGVAMNTLIPLVQYGSLEQDQYLQEHWAALLANAASHQGNVTPSFADILRQLTPQEAKLLNATYDKARETLSPRRQEPRGHSADSLDRISRDHLYSLYWQLGLTTIPPPQDRLRTSERRLNAIISSIPGAVWETSGSPDDPAKQVKFMSNQVEEMLGYSVEQWMTVPGLWPLIVYPDDRSRFVGEATEIFTSDKGSGSHQYRCLTKDGRTVWLESHASAIREQTGKPIGLRGVTIDITERKEEQAALMRAREELTRVSRAITMGEVAASIAHEINQPLAAVVTNGEACLRFLAATAPNIEKAKVILTNIISDGNRASEVIRRIRALFAKAGAHKEIFDLNQLIRDTTLLLQEYAQRHDVLVRTHLEEPLPPFFGDRTQLRQVLINLVRNGIEATENALHEARLVVIRTKSEAPLGVRLEVTDSGVGIQPGDRVRIFQPFYTTKEGGLGMGLSISRTIVESHGGRILVEPNQPHGTRFLVFLPNERMT